MTSSNQISQEQTLRNAIRQLNPEQYHAIRDAYYKAMEGLHALADVLETADLENGKHNDHALLQEHLLACEAIEKMDKSLLGKIV